MQALSRSHMHHGDYTRAIAIIDQCNSHCSLQLPIEMAVVYSVSLLHTGRGPEVSMNGESES